MPSMKESDFEMAQPYGLNKGIDWTVQVAHTVPCISLKQIGQKRHAAGRPISFSTSRPTRFLKKRFSYSFWNVIKFRSEPYFSKYRERQNEKRLVFEGRRSSF